MFERLSVVVAMVAVLSTPAFGAERTIVVLGDSLSSGYGLGAAQSWVDLLESHIDSEAYGYDVVNASIPGDTSSGALARLPRLLETYHPRIVLVELGGNDGLRGLPVQSLRANLERIVELVEAAGARAVLIGIQIPPNYGPTYTDALAEVYPELAKRDELALVPFLMAGVALKPELMQADGLHPNAEGQEPMFENVWAVLAPLLRRAP
jgi:acyl-CoA thioesterase I